MTGNAAEVVDITKEPDGLKIPRGQPHKSSTLFSGTSKIVQESGNYPQPLTASYAKIIGSFYVKIRDFASSDGVIHVR